MLRGHKVLIQKLTLSELLGFKDNVYFTKQVTLQNVKLGVW